MKPHVSKNVNIPLNPPTMQLLAGHQYSSRHNIIGTKRGITFQTRHACSIHLTNRNHQKRSIPFPISAELQRNTMRYIDNMEMESESNYKRKLRFLCLHGFRTSGEILKKQIDVKWPKSLRDKLDLVYVNAPLSCQGKSGVENIFDPPYYEWFHFISHKEFTEYMYADKSFTYVEHCMLKYGPFDGLLGFSQGAGIAAFLAGMQTKGLNLTNVPKIKYLIIIGGGLPKDPVLSERNAFSSKIQCKSIHFIGEKDYLNQDGIELSKSFVDPDVIYHSKGHIIPRLDKKNLEIMEKALEI